MLTVVVSPLTTVARSVTGLSSTARPRSSRSLYTSPITTMVTIPPAHTLHPALYSQSAVDWSTKLTHDDFPQDLATFPLVLVGRHGLATMYLWAPRLPAGCRFGLLVSLAPRSLLPLVLLTIGSHIRLLRRLVVSFRHRRPVATAITDAQTEGSRFGHASWCLARFRLVVLVTMRLPSTA